MRDYLDVPPIHVQNLYVKKFLINPFKKKNYNLKLTNIQSKNNVIENIFYKLVYAFKL